ncbi:MAG: cupredoxin family copper-binding protein [Chloroflexi bacterium]|nr:cupredoxin family copper-binding protein [Chloroflexota bacterium]
MSPEQNFKIPATNRLLLTRGLVMLAMLLIIFSLSCQVIPPQEEGVVPSALEVEPGLTPTTAAVKISGFAFLPATVTISAGTTVTWIHDDSPPHTVSSRDAVFDSGILSRGATFSYTFTRDGTFEYRCKIHSYMTAKIIVGEGGAVSPAEGTMPEKEAPLGGGGGGDY